jgi:hypothetical protein
VYDRSAIRTPRAAAVAGIVFALLLTATFVLVKWALPMDPEAADDWLTDGPSRDAVVLALNLLPFGGLLLSSDTAASPPPDGMWSFGRRVSLNLLQVYAMRMAAVFTISTTTIAFRLGLVPRWLAWFGAASGLVLLFTVGYVPWLEMIFPAWVFVLSVHILITTFSSPTPVGVTGRA